MPAAVHLPYLLRHASHRTTNAVSMVGDLALRICHELDTGAYPDIDVIEATVLRQAKNRKGTGTFRGSMSRFMAFLRAINVGAGRTVKMDVLRQVFESLGFSGVATFIASGNVVFETTTKNAKALERKIEHRLRDTLGYDVAAFLRTDAELAEIAQYTPFRHGASEAAAEVNIVFLADTLDEELKQKVMALRTDTDEFHVHGREIYWLRRKRKGRSPFSTVPLEKTLARPFTIRGVKTVKKMAVKYAPKS